MDFPGWLLPYRPLVPLTSLVQEINNIYHSFDAVHYDSEHLEMKLLWPQLWAQMIAQLPRSAPLRVLDFGCGTGFASEQILKHLGPDVEVLVAYDPSREMMSQCKVRLRDRSNVMFAESSDQFRLNAPYNLLITNSVLHHLVDIAETISDLDPEISADAYWLAGNEPSARFYQNNCCVHLFEQYSRYWARMKWFDPKSYSSKLRRILGLDTLSATAAAAVKQHLFATPPSQEVIDRLVDFHVAHSVDEANTGRGLDIEKLRMTFKSQWKLRYSTTYSYLGWFSEFRAPKKWREKARDLANRFPADGANFCAVWSR